MRRGYEWVLLVQSCTSTLGIAREVGECSAGVQVGVEDGGTQYCWPGLGMA